MKKYAFYLLAAATILSCKDNPNVPDPYIEFTSITRELATVSSPEMISVTFYFFDAGDDLGLTPSPFPPESGVLTDNDPPYNRLFYFSGQDGSRIADTDFEKSKAPTSSLITYRNKRSNKPDTLPSYQFPYTCSRWLDYSKPLGTTGIHVTDTVYFKANPDYYNLNVTLMVLAADGSAAPYDFSTDDGILHGCNPFGLSTRFPRVNNNEGLFDITSSGAHKGTITYHIVTDRWSDDLDGKKIKLRLQIKDRSLNLSNTIETTEVQL